MNRCVFLASLLVLSTTLQAQLKINGRQVLAAFNYHFANTLLRTPKVETADSVYFSDIQWESPKDSIQGTKHFVTIDEDNLIYDFHLDSLSTAKGLGCY